MKKLINAFKIERERKDKSGIYGYTQRTLAYNSNKIEGSTLTERQTTALFDEGYLPSSGDLYRAKDVEEMRGHFLMFNKMLDLYQLPLTEQMIKDLHYELKAGVFEDRANGYAIGDYKERPNIVGNIPTCLPKDVPAAMEKLLNDYNNIAEKDLNVLAKFHTDYEKIHPFQDGNGRTGRIILFKECLRNNIMPFIVQNSSREKYIEGLSEAREGNTDMLVSLFRQEQETYKAQCDYFEVFKDHNIDLDNEYDR